MPWLARLIPFARLHGRRVLEIGFGAGFDAYSFVKGGANYSGVDITPENAERARSHLALSGFSADFRHASAEALPFDDESFEVVFSNGVLHHLADPEVGFAEAARVLRPDGVGWIIVYNRDSIFYWFNLVLCRYILGGGFRHESLKDRLASIEHTTSGARPTVHLYSRRSLANALRRSGFRVEGIVIRKFNHEDVPEPGPFTRFWKRVPQSALDRVGRAFGWYLIAKVRKA
jgi:ubiquinone/menaquinone biosynthesis C-methylase UbiE